MCNTQHGRYRNCSSIGSLSPVDGTAAQTPRTILLNDSSLDSLQAPCQVCVYVSIHHCLQPATCANTKPITAAGTAFVCPSNKEFNPLRAESSPVNEEACCSKVRACVCLHLYAQQWGRCVVASIAAARQNKARIT